MEGSHVAGSTGTSDTRRSARRRTGRDEAAPRTVLDSASMPAPDCTPPSGENVSEAQPFDQRLLAHVLKRCDERVHGQLRTVVNDLEHGEVTREQYAELLYAFQDLEDALEFLKEYTHNQQQRDCDSINQSPSE